MWNAAREERWAHTAWVSHIMANAFGRNAIGPDKVNPLRLAERAEMIANMPERLEEAQRILPETLDDAEIERRWEIYIHGTDKRERDQGR